SSGATGSPFDQFFSSTSPHFVVAHKPLPRIISSSWFKILKTSRESENGRELVRVDYSSVLDHPKLGPQYSRGRGTIYFDPSRCWCIRRMKTATTVTAKGAPLFDQNSEIEYETTEHPSGFPLIKSQASRVSRYMHQTKEKSETQTKIEYQWSVNDRVPDAEFTLSAFGLPEPGGE